MNGVEYDRCPCDCEPPYQSKSPFGGGPEFEFVAVKSQIQCHLTSFDQEELIDELKAGSGKTKNKLFAEVEELDSCS